MEPGFRHSNYFELVDSSWGGGRRHVTTIYSVLPMYCVYFAMYCVYRTHWGTAKPHMLLLY